MPTIAVFSTKKYDTQFLTQYNENHLLTFNFIEAKLSAKTVALAQGADAICVFVNDLIDKEVLTALAALNIKVIALRCAGFNNIDLPVAKSLDFKICRVPEYSPEAVAEHTVGLMLTLSRKYHKAYNRVREGNFALDGLMGFNLHNKTVGVIGTGNIGQATLKILQGFGCNMLCYDPQQNEHVKRLGASYVDLTQLISQSDIISLHCPLNAQTQHLLNEQAFDAMKDGVMIINTSRGGLIDSHALIKALKTHKVALLGLDVYELESDLFFEDLSDTIIQDDVFERLLSFPNVLITGHQGFFTQEALATIAQTTISNLTSLLNGELSGNELF